MRFEGKVVLITGGGSGIGRATAMSFAEEGAKVVINDVSDHGQGVVNEITKAGGIAIFVKGSVENASDAERMVDETIKAFGRLDILFNNAGLLIQGRVDSLSLEDWDRTMAVNVRGMFLVSKHAVVQMRKQGGGAIINCASNIVLKALKNRVAYSASKGAVVALTKAMATDHASENIRVNCVLPGPIDTPLLRNRLREMGDLEEEQKKIAAQTPIGRIGKPEDVAAGILYFASDEASFVTGMALVIDGGSSA
jgi:NAD(P)-dependent dehydrogenase (short-subunit alcohol dehydrogenase family)